MVALLGACAGNPLAPVPLNSAAFELAGRMSVRSQERAFSSALRWKQGADGDEGATLTTAEQKQYRAQSIEALTQSAFGWRFPLAGLRYWVFGQTAPGVASSALVRDEHNRITRFTQADWQVAFEYATPASTRPSRLDVTGVDAQIRFVVDSLELAQP